MRLQTALGWQSLLVSSLFYTSSFAKKDDPAIKTTEFDFVPWGLQYFDDSDAVLFENRETKQVYRSEDAGGSWKPVSSVPEGELLELQMHPFDNKRAYIITEKKTHWKTANRGETWEEFKADSLASIFRQALTFHAGDPDRIIFNAMDCTGIFCEEVVSFFEGWDVNIVLILMCRPCIPLITFRKVPNSYEEIQKDVIGPSRRRNSQLGRRT